MPQKNEIMFQEKRNISNLILLSARGQRERNEVIEAINKVSAFQSSPNSKDLNDGFVNIKVPALQFIHFIQPHKIYIYVPQSLKLLLSGIDSCGDHILHLEIIEQASKIFVKSNMRWGLNPLEPGHKPGRH